MTPTVRSSARYEGVLYALEVCPSAIVAIKMQTSESKAGASERASERASSSTVVGWIEHTAYDRAEHETDGSEHQQASIRDGFF